MSTYLTLTSSCTQAHTVASDNCISTWASRSSSPTSPTPSPASLGNLHLHLRLLPFLLSTQATKTHLSHPPLRPSTHGRLNPARPLLRDIAGQPGSTKLSLHLLVPHRLPRSSTKAHQACASRPSLSPRTFANRATALRSPTSPTHSSSPSPTSTSSSSPSYTSVSVSHVQHRPSLHHVPYATTSANSASASSDSRTSRLSRLASGVRSIGCRGG